MHVVDIVGFGVEKGQKYWHVKNIWGTNWGDEGYFKMCRGINNLNIEKTPSAWAVPKDTWTNQVYHTTTEEEQEHGKNDKTVY